jgi:primosomal protein N' (replication factor Y)
LRGDLPFFSYTLKKEVQKRLDADQQVILFLNRRGHSPQLKCTSCGHVPSCPRCELRLTYHKVGRKLTCHYCGHVEPTPSHCPQCHKDDLIYLGVGTQKVEESLTRLFPDVKAVRLDSDVASGRRRAHQILKAFGDRKYQLLLGTQMVAKGLDFPSVTLVGVLAADMSMDLPDFRASERAFARLLQVAGRSGRAQTPGEVMIQTFYPESDLIDEAARQDYVSFFEREIESRRALQYPPFSRLVRVSLSSKSEEAVRTQALLIRDRLATMNRDNALANEILGPAPCPLYVLRGRYRRHIIIKTSQIVKLVQSLGRWEQAEPRFGLPAATRIVIDVDPDDMM